MLDSHGRIVENAIRFGVYYPSLEPADDAWAKGAIRVMIGNMVEDGISRSVDGNWPNHYSGYSVVLPDAPGLHQRRRGDHDVLDNRLFFDISPGLHMRIECMGNVHEPERWCVMDGRRPGEPVISCGFPYSGLPQWRERFDRLRTLFRCEGKQILGAVHRA